MTQLAEAEALVRRLELRLRAARDALGRAKAEAAEAALAQGEGDAGAEERLARAAAEAARIDAETAALAAAAEVARERLAHARTRSPTTASDDMHRRVQEQADHDNRLLDEAQLRRRLRTPNDHEAIQAATTLGVPYLTAEQRDRERRRQGWTYPPLHITGGVPLWRRCPPEAVPEPAAEAPELPQGPEGEAIAAQLAGLAQVGVTETGGAIVERSNR